MGKISGFFLKAIDKILVEFPELDGDWIGDVLRVTLPIWRYASESEPRAQRLSGKPRPLADSLTR